MKKDLIALTLLLILPVVGLSFSTAYPADIDKYVDQNGVINLTNVPRKEHEKRIAAGIKAAQSHCKVVAKDLKDQWLYYDNFAIYKISFGYVSNIDTYSCTISATHANIKDRVKEIRVEINKRIDSNRFTYRIVPDVMYPGCRKKLLTDCQKAESIK